MREGVKDEGFGDLVSLLWARGTPRRALPVVRKLVQSLRTNCCLNSSEGSITATSSGFPTCNFFAENKHGIQKGTRGQLTIWHAMLWQDCPMSHSEASSSRFGWIRTDAELKSCVRQKENSKLEQLLSMVMGNEEHRNKWNNLDLVGFSRLSVTKCCGYRVDALQVWRPPAAAIPEGGARDSQHRKRD